MIAAQPLPTSTKSRMTIAMRVRHAIGRADRIVLHEAIDDLGAAAVGRRFISISLLEPLL
jgi:hypothetical protein